MSESPITTKKDAKHVLWMLAGIGILAINIIRLVYITAVKSPYNVLWLSQWIGMIQGVAILKKLENKTLDGMYMYMFIFPLVAIFISTNVDVLFYINHIPHFVGVYMLVKKYDFEFKGVIFGLVFIVAMLAVTGMVTSIAGVMSLLINTVGSPFFSVILVLVAAWVLVLYFIIYKKK